MMNMILQRPLCLIINLFLLGQLFGQADRWQQKVSYDMDINFNVVTNQFSGSQQLTLKNNSPDQLTQVFYHLYFNAFQPNSMMDIRNRTIIDPDGRVGERIASLSPSEQGYHNILSLKQDGQGLDFHVEGTILEVQLARPIGPGESSVFDMAFESQVPIQIRRSGRDNAEGVRYSMAQWYPKMCEYDKDGWHANPYVNREFYGIWGDYDVSISIDQRYILAATGVLVNGQEMGYGYGDDETLPGRRNPKKPNTWNFKAENVHDFAWAADPDYQHTKRISKTGVEMHFFYKKDIKSKESWNKLPAIMDEVFDYANTHFGEYPYPVYSFVQGGDGGMEYPMLTLITGNRSVNSLVGVSVHELMHSWYQGVLATNESLYAWMDEGFASYASDLIENDLACRGVLEASCRERVFEPSTNSLIKYNVAGATQPMSIHADHFTTNTAYSLAAYVKGKIFLSQLNYIIGQENFNQGLKNYFNEWKFRHPTPSDVIRCMEKASGTQLDWFQEYFVNTTHLPDYVIDTVYQESLNLYTVRLYKAGLMPMPIDLTITYADGSISNHTIPLRMMRNEKDKEENIIYKVEPDWPWTHPYYWLQVPVGNAAISKVEIDPSRRLIDTDRSTNIWPRLPKE